MPTTAKKKPEKTPEELDEEELREVEAELKEVLELMTARHNREEADEALHTKRSRRDENVGNKQPVFHHEGSYHAATHMQTKTELDLAAQLKLRIRLGKHALNLNDTLGRLSARYVAVLERMLARSPH
jgi:hypothetical protein